MRIGLLIAFASIGALVSSYPSYWLLTPKILEVDSESIRYLRGATLVWRIAWPEVQVVKTVTTRKGTVLFRIDAIVGSQRLDWSEGLGESNAMSAFQMIAGEARRRRLPVLDPADWERMT